MPAKTPVKRASSATKKPTAKPTSENAKKVIAPAAAKTQARKTSAPKSKFALPSDVQAQQRTDLDIAHFRALLIDERRRMEEELDQVRSHSRDMENGLPEEGESGDEDTADLASAMMDKEMDLSVEDELEDVLSQVDRAFQKIEEGTYGICDVSGEPIPVSRLELIPFATLTVECQAMAES